MDSKEENNNIQERNTVIDDEPLIRDISLSESPKEKGCCLRCCGPIRAGSLRGASFAMCSITFGVGCLIFPSAVRITGPIIAVIFFAFLASSAFYTERLLVLSALKLNVFDYEELIKIKLGHGMSIFYDINNIVFLGGALMLFQKAIFDFGLNLLEIYFGLEKGRADVKLYLMLASYLSVQIPLSLLKDISKLQYAALVAIISLGYCIVVVMIEMPFYLTKYLNDGNSIPLYKPFDWSTNNYFDAYATFLFGFSCHNGILQILAEVKEPSEKRCKKIIRNAFFIEILLYSVMAFCGYFSTFDKTPDYFITREDLPGFKDYFIIFAQATLFICLHCIIAVNYNILRSSFRAICFKGLPINFYVDILICIGVLAILNIIVFYMEKVIDIIGIVAGFSNILICFIIPVMIYTRTFYHTWALGVLIPYTIMIFMTITGTICTIKSIVTFIQNLIA